MESFYGAFVSELSGSMLEGFIDEKKTFVSPFCLEHIAGY